MTGSDWHFIVLSFQMSVENHLWEEWEELLGGLVQGHVLHLELETMVAGTGRAWQGAPRAAQTTMSFESRAQQTRSFGCKIMRAIRDDPWGWGLSKRC